MSNVDVVIIGSGVAGMAAAHDLVIAGITNLVIIEAQERIGGRTHTIPSGDGNFIEFGAQWIHGSENNPIYDFCQPKGLINEDLKTLSGGAMHIATQDGTSIDESKISETQAQLDAAYEAVSGELDSSEDGDMSLGDLLAKHFQSNIDSSDDSELTRAAFDALLKEERINTACENLNELSARGWNSFADSRGDNMINLKYGYGRIIEELKKVVGADKIRLQEPVTKINYSRDLVEVTTKKSVYHAKCVLVTIPLGVLKEHHLSLFEPNLPENKQSAIERVGYGLVNKFFFVFEKRVFEDDTQGLQVLWRDDLKMELQAAKKHKIANEFYKTFNSYEVAPTMKNVLYTFLYGESALYSEKLSDQALIELCTEILSKCFPHIKLPRVKQLVRSKWGSHPWARGAYAHHKVGSGSSDVESLGEAIENKLFFAGEHTSVEFISTVHGAYATGKREAAHIVQALKDYPLASENGENAVDEQAEDVGEEEEEEEGGVEEESTEAGEE